MPRDVQRLPDSGYPAKDERVAQARRRQSMGCGSLLGCAFVFLILLSIVGSASLWVLVRHSPFSSFSAYPADVALGEIAESIMADLGENPKLTASAPAPRYPIAASVPEVFVPPLEDAFDYMRATDEGARLFDELLTHDVLVSVEALPYNAGYTTSSWTRSGWRSSRIVIATSAVRTRTVDVLAAILIHESAHADRAISETACYFTNSCESLPNGIEIQEEEYAHSVEAQFWQAMYGDDGKNLATGTATGENSLLEAYRKGPEEFDRYIRRIRGDSREGEGVAGA